MFQAEKPSSDASAGITDASSLVNISTILTNLGNIFSSNFGLKGVIDELGNIDTKAMGLARSFGVGQEQALKIKQSVIASREEIIKMGGSLDDAFSVQSKAAAALGRNVLLGSEAQKELFATFKVTGQEIGTVVSNLKDVGVSAYDAGNAMFEVVKRANEVGVSAQLVSANVLKNIGNLNLYNFKDGIDGLAKMTAQAALMRIDVGETFKFAEKVFNPEGAIQMAAALQRLGVTQSELLDPLNLMNLAENDPAELQNQLTQMSRQFVQMNEKGQFKILPGALRQMREIESKMGMAQGSLAKMAISSAEVEEKMKRIQFPSIVDEDQKKMFASISELKDGKVMITVNGEQMELSKALADASKEGKKGIEDLIGAAKPKSMEDLAASQLSALEEINVGIKLMTGVVPAAIASTKGGEAVLRRFTKTPTERVKAAMGTTGGAMKIGKEFNKITDFLTTASFTEFTDELKKATRGQGIFYEETMKGVVGLKDFTKELTGFDIDSISYASVVDKLDSVADKLKKIIGVNDAIITEEGIVKPLPEDDIVVGTGLASMIESAKKLKEVQIAQPKNILETIPSLQLEQKNLGLENRTPQTSEINLNIGLDFTNLPPNSNIDTAMVKQVVDKALRDTLLVGDLKMKLTQVSDNFGLSKKPK